MKKRILYLYTKIMPSHIPVFERITLDHDCEMCVFRWDALGNAPYEPPEMDGVKFHCRSEFTSDRILQEVKRFRPDLCMVSGWQDRGYLPVARFLRKSDVPVIVGFDDIWSNTVRQRVGQLVSPFLRNLFFSHAWVSGPRQYEYAKRLGFRDSKIVYHLYSGDTNHFGGASIDRELVEMESRKTFLFVGRLVERKAVDVLSQAFEIYRTRYAGTWKLCCVGQGPMDHLLKGKDGIELLGYLDQKQIKDLLTTVGAFVLPSRVDVSPLVVHEFASAGLPLILSDSIGNRILFLIENFNGYTFRSGSAEHLADRMLRIERLPLDELSKFGRNSYKLSCQHNAEFVAASLLSVLS